MNKAVMDRRSAPVWLEIVVAVLTIAVVAASLYAAITDPWAQPSNPVVDVIELLGALFGE